MKVEKGNIDLSKKYLIETWGCQMNEEDSEKLAGMLRSMGYESTMFRNKADVIIFNTCAVRENAELKVYGNIGALKALKRENPDMILAVCGCMMQQKGMPEEILRKYKHVDIVFGTHNAHKFPEYLERARTENAQICEIYEKETEIVEVKFIYDKLLLISKDDWKRIIDLANQTNIFSNLELSNVKSVQISLAKKEKVKEQALLRAYESIKKLKRFGIKV